jgi:hypothetical protein
MTTLVIFRNRLEETRSEQRDTACECGTLGPDLIGVSGDRD